MRVVSGSVEGEVPRNTIISTLDSILLNIPQRTWTRRNALGEAGVGELKLRLLALKSAGEEAVARLDVLQERTVSGVAWSLANGVPVELSGVPVSA